MNCKAYKVRFTSLSGRMDECLKVCVYPGSFDPITNGHLDVIERALGICDKLIVAVLVNSDKAPLFTLEERVKMIRKAVGNRENVEVVSFSGLLIDFVKYRKANAIIRGLRAVSDFEKEFQIALLNKNLDPEIESLFMVSNVKYTYLSSSIVKEIARYGGDISDLVPDMILNDITKKFECVTKNNK